jgi:CDP-glucose 4,6-dehydratase
MVAWEGKRVLVTGANGFVGSWVAKELVSQGAHVVTILRDIPHRGNLKLLEIDGKVTAVPGDIVSYETVERVFTEHEIDTCFHLAAQAIVTVANRSPLSTFNSNIRGTWNILEACRNSKTLQAVVVASSDKAYGVQKVLPYTEQSPLLGQYPYDASKACADILSRSYALTYGVSVAVSRCANIYGPGDMNLSRIIPDAVRCVLLGKEFVIRSDGTPERDYLYVKDAAEAYLSLAGNLHRREIRGQAFNFGSGKPISVLALFSKIASVCGKPGVRPKVLGEAKNEIDRQFLDSSKAKQLLGWAPTYNLDQGLEETAAWWRKDLGL